MTNNIEHSRERWGQFYIPVYYDQTDCYFYYIGEYDEVYNSSQNRNEFNHVTHPHRRNGMTFQTDYVFESPLETRLGKSLYE